jgi:hypothetical protein
MKEDGPGRPVRVQPDVRAGRGPGAADPAALGVSLEEVVQPCDGRLVAEGATQSLPSGERLECAAPRQRSHGGRPSPRCRRGAANCYTGRERRVDAPSREERAGCLIIETGQRVPWPTGRLSPATSNVSAGMSMKRMRSRCVRRRFPSRVTASGFPVASQRTRRTLKPSRRRARPRNGGGDERADAVVVVLRASGARRRDPPCGNRRSSPDRLRRRPWGRPPSLRDETPNAVSPDPPVSIGARDRLRPTSARARPSQPKTERKFGVGSSGER